MVAFTKQQEQSQAERKTLCRAADEMNVLVTNLLMYAGEPQAARIYWRKIIQWVNRMMRIIESTEGLVAKHVDALPLPCLSIAKGRDLLDLLDFRLSHVTEPGGEREN
ncbi:hypothetical protein LCGC14_1546510 [marine sediment metagenome]|uniref:Uncharacterized protein n=1 Tax=marine sediment metagenome TaxID=412755 RepID=A0A0F9LSC3_9ZZZZ